MVGSTQTAACMSYLGTGAAPGGSVCWPMISFFIGDIALLMVGGLFISIVTLSLGP